MEAEDNGQTLICGIVFLDIAQFSQQPGDVQFSWRIEFSMLLDRCLEGVEPERRIVADTSNGASLAFPLSAADAFLFVRRLHDELQKPRAFALRVGAHLGLLHMAQGPGGRPGIAGEGANAAQRAMRFAGSNEVLVSRSFQEEVTRLFPDSASMFTPRGRQSGKLGREHDLFRMSQPPEPAEPAEPAAAPLAQPAPLGELPTASAREEPPTASASGEPPVPAAPDTCDASAPPTEARPPSFALKIALAVLLAMIVGAWLWFAQGNREKIETAPPAQDAAAPAGATEAAPEADVSRTDDPAASRQPELPGAPAEEEPPHLTEAPPSGKVPAGRKELGRCPNCSCTDLMTKLSLGGALNENERRYLAERCKK